MEEGTVAALKNWVNRMDEEEREALIEILEDYRTNHNSDANNEFDRNGVPKWV